MRAQWPYTVLGIKCCMQTFNNRKYTGTDASRGLRSGDAKKNQKVLVCLMTRRPCECNDRADRPMHCMCPLLCRGCLYTPRIGFILSARARFVWEATVAVTHQAGAQQTRGTMTSKARA